MHGIGPTPTPRPQRMHPRFAAPIDTTKPARVSEENWVATVKQEPRNHWSSPGRPPGHPQQRSLPGADRLAWRTATEPLAELKGGVHHGFDIR